MPASSMRRTKPRTTSAGVAGIATITSLMSCCSATASTSLSGPSTGTPCSDAPIFAASSSRKPATSTPSPPGRSRSRQMDRPCSPAPTISTRWREPPRRTARRPPPPHRSIACQRRAARVPTDRNSESSAISRIVAADRRSTPVVRASSSPMSTVMLDTATASTSARLVYRQIVR